jgi:hypothetical protein
MAYSDRLLAFNHRADSDRHAAGWPRQFCPHVLQMATAATNRVGAGAVACRCCCANSHSVLKVLEAAIGIEPMNKGFAEMDYVFAQVPICSLVPILIGVSGVSCLRMISQIRPCCDW